MDEILQRLGLNVEFPFILTTAGLIWARMLSVMSVIPFLFAKPTPRTVRVGASMVLTVFLYPILSKNAVGLETITTLDLFVLYLKEVLFGLSLGFMVSIIFYGFQSAGQMIDNQRGVSLARILIPELGEQASITSHLLFSFAVVIFLLIGGHRMFLKALMESYLVLPILKFPPSVEGLLPLMDLFGVMTAKILFLSVQLAAPVIISILMVDIILGVANRFAPQINVWELGFNVRGYIGILILFLSISYIGEQVIHYTLETKQGLHQMMELMQPPPPKPPAGAQPAAPQEEEELQAPSPVVPSP